jgi:hypothetical protein
MLYRIRLFLNRGILVAFEKYACYHENTNENKLCVEEKKYLSGSSKRASVGEKRHGLESENASRSKMMR